jgi:hypothetical protein
MKVKRILVLVELDNGHAHQVLTSYEKKEICLNLMKAENGEIMLSKRIKPVILEFFDKNE